MPAGTFTPNLGDVIGGIGIIAGLMVTISLESGIQAAFGVLAFGSLMTGLLHGFFSNIDQGNNDV